MDHNILKVGSLPLDDHLGLTQFTSNLNKNGPPSSQKDVFKHKPILKHIRLLKLHPRSVTGEITCDLEDVFLGDSIPFEAISYTWGSPTPAHEILINDFHYTISPNAYNALASMTSILHSKYVWIDSVCVDQSNNEEKNQQILLMEEIYRRAACVVVWLGEADDSHLAFELLEELSYLTQTLNMTDLYQIYSPQISMPKWQALNKLVRSPWFDRVWVLQEVAMASSVKVRYGSKVMDWEELQRRFFTETTFVGPAQLCAFLVPHVDKGKVRDPMEVHHARTMGIIKRTILKNEKKTLFACLELCMSFLATDPKDLVFALQAISEEGFTTLTPDYKKSVNQVFTEATHAILTSTQQNRLSVLSLAGTGFHRDMASLPSWVPEWGSGDRTTSLTNSCNRKATSVYDYRASSNTHPEISPVPGTLNFLMVNGIQADEIMSLGTQPALQFSQPTDPASKIHASELYSAWMVDAATMVDNRIQDPYSTSQEPTEVFWRTLIGDRLLTSEGTFRVAPLQYGNYFHASMKIFPYKMRLLYGAAHASEIDLTSHVVMSIPQAFGSFEAYAEVDTQGSLFEAAMGPHTYRRTFCCTKNGYVGLVPPGTRIGDVVCVLFGMQTPVVLRKIEDGESDLGDKIIYELVGECYIHGIMDGEMLEAGFEKRAFVLR
ncbi:Heterokaryon incompatibility protein [Rutstroemia sp. NJR-2017a BBW]|nr:Heterokaryon incompatibility protein [Rutstroemia sp. NJR-2017a BBW]